MAEKQPLSFKEKSLDINTPIDRPVVKINGYPHEMRISQDLGFVEKRQLRVLLEEVAVPLAKVQDKGEEALTNEDLEDLQRLLRTVSTMILPTLPDSDLDNMGVDHQIRLVNFFNEVQNSLETDSSESEQKTTTKSNSRSQNRSRSNRK